MRGTCSMLSSRIFLVGQLIFVLAWLVSDHYPPWHSFHSEMLAWVGLAALVAGALLGIKNKLAVPKLSLWIAGASLLPWVQYAAGISLFAGDAWLSSIYLTGLLMAVIVGYGSGCAQSLDTSHRIDGLMHCLWLAAFFSAAIGLAQWLSFEEFLGVFVVHADSGARAMGNIGQPNQLATLLIMGMAAYLLVYERRIIGEFAFLLGICFLTLVLILAQSRTGMLSVFVVTIFLFWKTRMGQTRLSSGAVLWWVFGFVMGTLLLPYLAEYLLMIEVRSLRSGDPISQRIRMWQQIAHAVAQSPWTGYGWNQTPTAHGAGAVAYPGEVTYTNAHNIVMDLMAWNGLPLGLFLSGITAYWFVSRMLACRSLESVVAMACLLPVAVHSMLEYPYAYSYFLISVGFLVGIVESSIGASRIFIVDRRWVGVLLAVWVSTGSYLVYEYLLIETDFQVTRFENLRVGQTPEHYVLPTVRVMTHLAAMLRASRQVAASGMTSAEIENLRRVSARFPYGALRFRYALALALNGKPGEASHQMAILKGMYGNIYYGACKDELRRLETEKYPQLASVMTP